MRTDYTSLVAFQKARDVAVRLNEIVDSQLHPSIRSSHGENLRRLGINIPSAIVHGLSMFSEEGFAEHLVKAHAFTSELEVSLGVLSQLRYLTDPDLYASVGDLRLEIYMLLKSVDKKTIYLE
jgi:hypothetical protein